MKAWTRRATLGGARYRTQVDDQEVEILRALIRDVAGVLAARRDSAPVDELSELTGIRSGHADAPAEEPLARLLPDFHRPEPADGADDATRERAAAAENTAMRSVHEPDIIDGKLDAARVMEESLPGRGGTISLTRGQAEAWLAFLNDMRLAIGSVLLAEDPSDRPEIPDEVPPGDARAARIEVYHWLTFAQDSLCAALLRSEA